MSPTNLLTHANNNRRGRHLGSYRVRLHIVYARPCRATSSRIVANAGPTFVPFWTCHWLIARNCFLDHPGEFHLTTDELHGSWEMPVLMAASLVDMRLGAVPRELFLANSSAPSRSLEWLSWQPRGAPSSPVGQLYKYDPMNCLHAKRRRAGLRIQDSTAAGSRIHSKDESQGICAAWAAMRQTPEGNRTAIIHRPPAA
jgi:hypothetical protein